MISPRKTRLTAGTPTIAFGPESPGIGSWEWIGQDMAQELSGDFQTITFRERIPECDAVVFIKDKFCVPAEEIFRAAQEAALIFCPVDLYGSSAEIDRDWQLLRRCSRIVTHSENLRKYFQSYAPVEYLDHHLKFTAPLKEHCPSEGPILWTGMRSNLPPLAKWVNQHSLPAELWILTNLEENERNVTPQQFGFRENEKIRIEKWNPQKHREWIGLARAAIDIKGDDFRQRHKPPTKALDCLASGLPLAMNQDSNSVSYLARLGFEVAAPDNQAHWFSQEYWEQIQRLAKSLRQELSRGRIGQRFKQIIEAALAERNHT